METSASDQKAKYLRECKLTSTIYELKEAQKQVHLEKQRLANIIEGTNTGTWEWNVQTGETIFNRRWAEIVGYSLEELWPVNIETWLRFVHPEDLKASEEQLNQVFNREKEYYSIECRMKHKSGHWVWVIDTGKVISWTDDGKPLWMFGTHTDITEAKEAQQKLAEREKWLELFFQQSLSGFFFMMLDEPVEWNDNTDKEKVMDYVFAHQRITKVNQAMLDQYRMTEEEFLYKTPNELFAHDIEQGRKVWKDFFDRGQLHIDTDEQRADGTQMWIEGDYICLYDEEGRIIGHFGTQQDITQRKMMEKELAERDRLLSNLSQQVPGSIYQYLMRVDGTSCFPFASQGIWDVYEVTPEEIKKDASKVFTRIHPEDYDQVVASINNSFTNLSIWEDQYRVILPEKGLCWVRGLARPEKLSDGSVLWHGYLRNVTENKKIEDLLYLEKEQFKTTLLSVGDGVISTDNKGKIMVINKVAENLTGWAQEEAYGKPLEEVFNIINEFTRETCPNPAKKVLETGDTIELANHTLLIAKNGSEIPIEDSAAPIKDNAGTTTGVVLVFRDATEKIEKLKQIEYLSFHDYLTGLYNRRYMEDTMMRLDTSRNLPFTIMVLDVNGLKLTNDAFGHQMGDKLLRTVADILKKVCRFDDIICRIGGDEFIILLPKTDEKQAEKIRQRINNAALNAKLDAVIVSLAIGYAVKTNHDEDIVSIKNNADKNMYKDKLQYGKTMRSQTIETVLRSINSKYDEEQIHTERVSQYCEVIARAMELSEKEISDIKTGGALHDIGKIVVSPEILNKPGKLTGWEFDLIKRHCETGYQILRQVGEYSALAELALYHHERWDGLGYPEGLRGERIPLGARIIAVADAFEAMTAKRAYQKSKTGEEAIVELLKHSGTQFDPEIVKVFIEKVLK